MQRPDRPNNPTRAAAPWRIALLAGAALSLFPPEAAAVSAKDLMDGLGNDNADQEVADMLGVATTRDLSKLNVTHLSVLSGWESVKHRKPVEGETNAPCHWKDENGLVAPLDHAAIGTLIDVPEDGAYRLFLRQQLSVRSPRPVTFSLTPQSGTPNGTNGLIYADAGPKLTHLYGNLKLAGSQTGREQEKSLPLRFEAETQLIAMPPEPALVWEYWDTDLKKGIYRAELSGADKAVRAHSLLLSRSKDFRPSFSPFGQDKTLGRLYMRVRVLTAAPGSAAAFTLDSTAGYHWGPREENNWSWPIGTAAATPVGGWSPYVEATDALVNGPGPWSTCWIHFGGVKAGEAEVQFAWQPEESAAVLTVKTGIGGGRAMLRVPNGDWTVQPDRGRPAWGLWEPARVKSILTLETVIGRYFTWAEEAALRLGVPADHPRPKRIRLSTGCGVPEPNQARAAEMLAKLGLNWIDGAPESVVKKYGLIEENVSYGGGAGGKDPLRVTKIKLGDEITTRTDPGTINNDVGKRARFLDYLAEQARLDGQDLKTFLGVQDVRDIDCMGRLPPNAGRYERRLFYHSQRFSHLITCDNYAAQTRAVEKRYPNARVYNNYSPHPLFLTGTTMNDTDWFVLARHQAQTLGWGEDWATGGGWGLGTAFQCTSFYAALVDCSVRKYGYAAGFYVGSNCGGSAQKIFGCVAQGVTWLHLYDWGPIDRWAEGSNAWSEMEGQYYAVMCAAYALGPADEIIGAGTREPRRTAILYNRSHEILNGGAGRMNHDWMWTFIAMKSAHIPVDVIIEEDLNPGDLKRYDCIFLGGYNLAAAHLGELRKWVEAGGLLIGTAGAAARDVYDEPLAETVRLFGARQHEPDNTATGSVSRVAFAASPWFPASEFKLRGVQFLLEPTTGTPLARYGGGECAAVANAVGKGHAVLLGFQPGVAYRDNGQSKSNAVGWLAAPVLKRLGRQRVEFDWPTSEATLFEHESGLAVMLADFAWPPRATNSFLSVQTDRPIKTVTSALRGPLAWKRNGDRIEIVTPPLKHVDVVILK